MKKASMKQSTLCNIMAGVSIIFGVAIFVSVMMTSQTFTGVANLNSSQTQIYKDMRTLVNSVNYIKDMTRSYSQDGNNLYMDMLDKKLVGEETIPATLERLKVLVTDPRGQEQVAGVEAKINIMTAIKDQAVELVKAGKLAEAKSIIFGKDYGIALDNINLALDEFQQGMDRGIGAIIQRQSNSIIYLGMGITALCGLLIAVQIMTAFATQKKIIAPIIKLKNSMVSMDEGHLSGAEDVAADSTEIGMLAGAMYSMRNRVNEYIKEISLILHSISQKNMQVDIENEYVGDFSPIQSSLTLIIESLSKSFESFGYSTDGISMSAEQVSQAAQDLAQGATVQASSVEQLSASISEISSQLGTTAVNAETAKTLALASESNLNSSSQQMSHMVQAISEISDSSSQISKIIKTIEDIAFQTNILALNAAVEAARAGSAGKGFAVVADEVRNLATKSSDAAKQTNVLIENSVRSVESGVRIADETAHALTEVVTSSQRMAKLVSEISQASSEQAAAIAQINLGVEQISSVVQTNSATSEETAATSVDLSNQTRAMKTLISSFKIKSTI